MNLENRIVKLEEMVSLQKEELLHISKELYAQHQESQRLREQLLIVTRRFKEMTGGHDSGIRPVSEETPPPHY